MKKNAGLSKKDIRVVIVRQLKKQYPGFKRLKRKEKREVIQEACRAARQALDNDSFPIPALSPAERVGLEKVPDDLVTQKEMAKLIEDSKTKILRFRHPDRSKYLENPLLCLMDEMLDDPLLNTLLAGPSLTPQKRDWMPAQLLRMELLHTAVFSSFSYRDFCEHISSPMRKEERAFCGFALRKGGATPHHSTLSAFRTSLTLSMRVNLVVWMLHHFLRSDHVGERVVHMLDSTDVAIPVNPYTLVEMDMPDGTKLRLYADLDCDCGRRRKKRDRSARFVGYRVHTLSVTDVETGIAFPMLSLAVAANHHDLPVMEPLLALAQAIGLDLKLLVRDQGYASAPIQEKLRREHGILLITPSEKKALTPEDVEPDTGAVFCHGACETPMAWLGHDDETGEHVFHCERDDHACPFDASCPKERLLKLDTGLFGPIPTCVPNLDKANTLRKVCERPFNLMKHVDGLETRWYRSHKSVQAQLVFSQMIGLFKVLAGQRSQAKTETNEAQPTQEALPFARAS